MLCTKRTQDLMKSIQSKQATTEQSVSTIYIGARQRTLSSSQLNLMNVDIKNETYISSIDDAMNELSQDEIEKETSKTDIVSDEDDFMFYDDYLTEEVVDEVPVKFYDGPTKKLVDNSTKSLGMKKSVSMVNLDSTGSPVSCLKTSQPSLKKNLSYCALSDAMKDSSKKPMKRNVSFSSLEIREYDITLGDNPSVRKGPPVSLSWDYKLAGSIDLEKFESNRGRRRSKEEMVLGPKIRQHILRNEAGVSTIDIVDSMSEVQKIKGNRKNSVSSQHLDKVYEVFESASRKIRRTVKRL